MADGGCPKVRLMTPMFVNLVRGRLRETMHVIEMKVAYEKMALEMVHSITCPEPLSCTVDVVKTRRKELLVTMRLERGCCAFVKCYLYYSDGRLLMSPECPAVRFSAHVYEMRVQQNAVEAPTNEILRDSGCVRLCVEASCPDGRVAFTPRGAPLCGRGTAPLLLLSSEPSCSRARKTDEEKLAADVEHYVSKSTYECDFMLCLRDGKLPATRALLSARSTFFRRRCEGRRACRLPLTFQESKAPLRFLYFGHFDALPLDHVLATLNVASKLGMRGLMDACVGYVLNNITIQDKEDVRDIAEANGIRELLNVVEMFDKEG